MTHSQAESRRAVLQDWARLLAGENHVLKECPALLFQQAANQADTSALAGLARARLDAGLEPRPWLRWIDKPAESRARLLTLTGHLGPVKACAFSPDGRYIASGSDDLTVRIWDAATGVVRMVLRGHRFHVEACAFLPSGGLLVACGGDVRLWDVEAGIELATLVPDVKTSIRCVASAVGERAAIVSYFGGLHLVDLTRGSELGSIDRPLAWRDVAFSPDGARLACACSDGRIELRDAATLEAVREWQAHDKDVTACAFSPDGAWLVSGSYDKTLKIWDVERAVARTTIAGHGARALAVSPDGRSFVAASNALRIYDAAGGTLGAELRDRGSIEACAYSPDGARIVSACSDALTVWDAAATGVDERAGDTATTRHAVRRGEAFAEMAATPAVRWCAFAPGGRLVASARFDGVVTLRDAAMGRVRSRLDAHADRVVSCAFAPDAVRLTTASWDGTLRLWDMRSGETIAVLEGHGGPVTACAFAPDGRWILSSATDKTLRVWDAQTGRSLRVLQGHDAPVNDCAISPDGRLIASASDDGTLRMWGPGGRAVRVIRSESVTDGGRDAAHRFRDRPHSVFETVTMRGYQRGGFRRCAFTPDGARIVSLTAEQQIRIWDARTGSEVKAPEEPKKVVEHSPLVRKFTAMLRVGLHGRSGSVFETFAISPDGSRIAGAASRMEAAGYERWGAIGLWDLATCEEALTLWTGAGYRSGVVSCVFSPSGRLLAGGSQDGRITIWETTSGRTVGAVWADGEVEALAWSPVEDTLAAGDARGVVRILRLENVAPSPLVAVGWRRPPALAFFRRERDGEVAFGCPACREWTTTSSEPGAVFRCPRCATPLRLAPFLIEEDWDAVAAAWRRGVRA